MNDRELVAKAFEAREKSYSPYSKFKIGAALLTKDGHVFLGCNIESASYTPTNCAERTAFFKAVSEGHRQFTAIAIVGGYDGQKIPEVMPCGVCRQVMAEFCEDDFRIILSDSDYNMSVWTMDDILPKRFGPQDLAK